MGWGRVGRVAERAEGNPGPFFGGGGGQRRNAQKGRDVSVRVEVSLEDIYNGAERTAEIERRVICRG